jgi:hypothetical protein
VFKKTVPCTTVLFINEDTYKSQITGLSPDFQIKFFFPVEFNGPVLKFAFGKFSSRFYNILLFFGSIEIHPFAPSLNLV